MAQPVSSPHDLVPAPQAGRVGIGIAAAALGAAVLLGTLVLWAHYGTAVFFDMITSGIAACL